jgi:hypothetical protein
VGDAGRGRRGRERVSRRFRVKGDLYPNKSEVENATGYRDQTDSMEY